MEKIPSLNINMWPYALVVFLIILSTITLFIFLKTNRPSLLTAAQPTPTATTVAATSDAVISKSEADVTIAVRPTLVTIGQNPSFEISMDTHSVPLDFNIASITKLTDKNGETYGQALWQGTKSGGHHQKGTLIFQAPISNKPQKLYLTFQNIGGIPLRMFEIAVP